MKAIYLLITAIAIISLSSCRKCVTCSYTYTDLNNASQTYEFPEECGSKQDMDAYEAQAKQAASTFAGSTLTCE
jgi:hypothetical protein